MLNLRADSRNITMVSDDERTVINSYIVNLPEEDKRNPYNNYYNDKWYVYEGRWLNNWQKVGRTMDGMTLIAKHAKSDARVLSIAFITGRYKKAITDYINSSKEKKGTKKYSELLDFDSNSIKYSYITTNQELKDLLLDANPYKVKGYGFTKIEKIIGDYGDFAMPTNRYVKYTAAYGRTYFKSKPYYTPLCTALLMWNDYYHTGQIIMDYMPEYLNIEAWQTLFSQAVRNFFIGNPDRKIIYMPKEDWEIRYCKKLGFSLTENPLMDDNYILDLKNFKDVD